jgi:hypothetical protein
MDLVKYLFPDELLRDQLTFLISPLLLRGKITTLFAPAGAGKSTFVYKIVQNSLKSQVLNKVLCIFSDADTTNAEFQALVKEYFDRNNLSKSRFIPIMPDQRFWRDLKKSIESETLKKEGIDLVIVDSLEQFFDLVGLDFHRSVGVFFGVLRRLAVQGVSILLLHHTNKGGVEFSGRATIVNQSDVVYRLRKAGKYKWFGDAVKHRGTRELEGKIDFYAELTKDGIEFSTDMVDDRLGYVVHLIKQVLGGKGRLRQYELIELVRKKAREDDAEVGKHKIREALAKYDGIYWTAERGERNSLEYELIVQVSVKVEKDEEKERLIAEIESMVQKGWYYGDDLPPLNYNGKTYKVLTDIEREVPTDVLRKYVERLRAEAESLEEISEDF